MNWFKSGDLLDQAFAVGIILKGLDGVLEVVGGEQGTEMIRTLFAYSPKLVNHITAMPPVQVRRLVGFTAALTTNFATRRSGR